MFSRSWLEECFSLFVEAFRCFFPFLVLDFWVGRGLCWFLGESETAEGELIDADMGLGWE